MNKKLIVISGINLFSGGTLSIYYDFLDELVQKGIYKQYTFIVFVHKKELFKEYNSYFEIVELPKSRKNWINRLYYEYFYFHTFSKTKNIFLWISLHDMTPRVICEYQATYCHNPMFSYHVDLKDFWIDKKIFLFSKFYKYLYKINIKKNDYVIVQQDWIAFEFIKLYNINKNNIVVFPADKTIPLKKGLEKKPTDVFTFFYPAFPRTFKNFEVLCKAAKIIQEQGVHCKIKITLKGDENRYAKRIYENYSMLDNVIFLGLLSREEVFKEYSQMNCLLFPSKLETWGLPISEAKLFDLPIVVADLPYAHETVGNYDKVCFFNPESSQELAKIMLLIINNQLAFVDATYQNINTKISSWQELLGLFETKR